MGESTKGEARGKAEIDEAIDRSVKLGGGPKKTTWIGADKRIAAQRPKDIFAKGKATKPKPKARAGAAPPTAPGVPIEKRLADYKAGDAKVAAMQRSPNLGPLKATKPIKVKTIVTGSEEFKATVHQVIGEIEKLVTHSGTLNVDVAELKGWERAWASGNKIHCKGQRNTIAHEFGHILENHLPGAKQAAREFLEYRTKGEQIRYFNEVMPGRGFESYEKGFRDQFDKAFGEKHAYYVGKVYGGDSTEIISMGVEKLLTDPTGFAKADPEYFKFITGILDGELRSGVAAEIGGGGEALYAPLAELDGNAVAAIKEVEAVAEANETAQLDQVAKHISEATGKTVTREEVAARLEKAFDDAEITINFRPAQKLPNGQTAAQAYRADPRYKSLFESNITSVSEKADVEHYLKSRTGFEVDKISAHAANVPAAQRPKYAAVNWRGTKGSYNDLYGDGVFVLRKEALKDRMTLAPGNTSWTHKHEAASALKPANTLSRSQLALRKSGLTADAIKGTRGLESYTEVQIWGDLPISKETVKEIRLKKPTGWFGGKIKAANAEIEAMAKDLDIPIVYY